MRLTKHHGLGNDFLVLIDLDDLHPIDESIARRLCDRNRGVGADGLIRVTRGDTAGRFRMELRNEDGSRAEMSGNGISCLGQALVLTGAANGEIDIDTDAGPRRVTVVDSSADVDGGMLHRMRVAMGVPEVVGPGSGWVKSPILDTLWVDVGNPHLVCRVDPESADDVDLITLGALVNREVPGGANVELLRPAGDGAVTMAVYERGVGLTEACGTGAVAAATAAAAWGLTPTIVTVHQPGGDAVVELGVGPSGVAHLTVPVVAIASIEWLQ